MSSAKGLRNVIFPATGTAFSRFTTKRKSGFWYIRERCPEHGVDELIRQAEFYTDLGYWYHAGMHPRFSITGALKKARQTRQEVGIHIGLYPNSFNDEQSRRDSESRKRLYEMLRDSQTATGFLEKMRLYLFTNLVVGGQTFRVRNSFKDKFDSKTFTNDEFFTEGNQELRRLMTRAGITIKAVLERMELIAKDEEGALYEIKDDRERPQGPGVLRALGGSDHPRYLYVVCPSTGQEYLLQVPNNFSSPKEARRWTFDLSADAEFVKEA